MLSCVIKLSQALETTYLRVLHKFGTLPFERLKETQPTRKDISIGLGANSSSFLTQAIKLSCYILVIIILTWSQSKLFKDLYCSFICKIAQNVFGLLCVCFSQVIKLKLMQAVRGMEWRSSYIVCFRCEKTAEQPRMCSRCARTFCNSCLLIAILSETQQCPSCGIKQKEQDYIYPEAVVEMVNSIAQKVKKQQKRGDEREQCANHQLPLSYFCVDCNHPLCADCGLLSSSHTGHRFVSYRDIYERIKQRVFEEFPRFDRKIRDLQHRKTQIYGRLEQMYDQYRNYKKKFEEAYINYTQRVQGAAKNQEQYVNARYQANQHRLVELQHLRDNIYEEMQKKTQLTLINQSQALAQSIKSLSAQQPPIVAPEKADQSIELIELVPQFFTWTFRLEGFSLKTGIVYSQGKMINGVQWRLKIYPKGNGLARQKYLSVFVQMTKALSNQNKYQYRIELINPVDPTLTIRRQYTSTFEIGQCWGYNQFEPLDQLHLKDYILEDSLTFRIGIRNRSYRSLVQDQSVYIQHIKKQIQQRQKKQEESRIKKIKSIRQKILVPEKRSLKKISHKSPQKMEKLQNMEQYEERQQICISENSGIHEYRSLIEQITGKK